MDIRTKYYTADMILGLIVIFALYVTFGLGSIYLDYVTQKGPEDFDEPWLWFGCMAFMPLAIVFYDTILIKLGAIVYNKQSEYRMEFKGDSYDEIRLRPLRMDFPVLFIFLVFTPYISQQVYGMMEGSSTFTFAVIALVPAMTCVCALFANQRFCAWMDTRFKAERERRKAERQRLKEALQ